jgi:hypothetical protein
VPYGGCRRVLRGVTNCVGHPHVQCGVVFETWMLASHAFNPRTSVRSRKAAIDSAFVCPSYRGRVGVDHGVLHVVALRAFAASFQRRSHSLSAHLTMHVVDLHLCWWPPILCCRSGAPPARRRVSAWCCSSSRISCSLSVARRRRASWLVGLGAVPLRGGLAPRMRSSVWYISFSTRWPCAIDALYIVVASIYKLGPPELGRPRNLDTTPKSTHRLAHLFSTPPIVQYGPKRAEPTNGYRRF